VLIHGHRPQLQHAPDAKELSAETRSQLKLSIQKIVVLFDGFAGRGADADLERAIGIFLECLSNCR